MTRRELVLALGATVSDLPADAEVVVTLPDAGDVGYAIGSIEVDPAGVIVIRTEWRP